jgi:hypothetical protein
MDFILICPTVYSHSEVKPPSNNTSFANIVNYQDAIKIASKLPNPLALSSTTMPDHRKGIPTPL